MSNKKNEHTQIGWPTFPIGELLAPLDGGRTLHQGWSPRCEKEPSISETEWGVLKTTSIQPAAFLPEHNKRLPDHLEPRPQIEVKPGDILITCAGPRNRCGIACLVRTTRRRLMMSGKMYRFRPDPARVDPRYLEAYLQSAVAQGAIDEMKTGGNESGLNLTHDRFRKLPVPVAPLDQQKRIVAEIEKQFSRLDEAVANLKRVKANLKRYKAAVLKAAVEGHLVETEAELARRDGRSYETGAKLLQRILETRRSQWQGKGKYKEPAAPDTTNLPELPDGWVWASVEQLTWLVTSGSRGWGDYYSEKGFLFIRAQDIKTDVLTIGSVARVNIPTAAEGTRSSVSPSDILITITGANVTRSALVPSLDEVAYVSQHVALLKLNLLDTAQFVFCWIVSPTNGRKALESWAYGAGKPGLSLEQVRSLPVALPPLAEQHRIVSEVDRRISILRETEAQVDANLQRAERLRQSILSRAFSGGSVSESTTNAVTPALSAGVA